MILKSTFKTDSSDHQGVCPGWPRRLVLVSLLVLGASGAWYLSAQGQTTPPEGGTITGIIVDEVSAPIAGAKVTLVSQDYSSSALTQADGKFEFTKLAQAQYRITVEAAGFRKETVAVAVSRSDEAITRLIKLKPSSLHVVVLDAVSRQALAGVIVTLLTREHGAALVPGGAAPIAGPVAARVTTDEGGDAYFGRLGAGSYQLTAALRGYDEYRSEVFISPGRVTTEFTLPLSVAPVIPINDRSVTRYNVPNLPSKNVQAIFQDSEGWVWFGTDKGVARFNGGTLKSSSTAGSGYSNLAGLDVRCIAEDRAGTIWLATPYSARRITKDGDDAGELLSGHDVRHLLVDSRGNVWIATSNGAFLYDGRELNTINQPPGLDSNDAIATAEDREGNIWIATSKGVAVLDGVRGTPLQPLPSIPDLQSMAGVRSLFADRSGAIWITTVKKVVVFDGKQAGSLPKTLNTPAGEPSSVQLDVTAVSQDQSGRLWFALESGGALLYDPARRESQRLSSLDRDRVATVYTDREGNTWFGTDNGAISADLYSFVNFNTSRGLSDNDVRAVVEAPAGTGSNQAHLWFATAAGISRMEGERLTSVEGFRGGISVHGVAFDRVGAAWLATEQGVFRWNGQTLTQLNEGNGLASNNVHWVASTAAGSAMVFATAKGTNIFKDGSLVGLDQLAGYDVRHVFENIDGRLWFSTGRGVVIYDPQSGAFFLLDSAQGLADNDVRWITRFHDRLIVATHAGVQSYKSSQTRKADESPFATVDSDPATTLFVDRDGFLWVGSENGDVKKFASLGTNLVSNTYSSETNALSGKRINSISEDREGRIWIATNAGAVRHIPMRISPPTQLSLEVDGRVLRPDETGGRRTEDGRAAFYGLPYGHHRLIFHFTGVSMNRQVRYLYRISSGEGSEPWLSLPLQQGAEREVPVFDIGEGEHCFEVITLNRDLYGAADTRLAPTAALILRVGAPFWKSGWFYLLCLALASLSIAIVVAGRRLRERGYVLPKALRTYVRIEPNPFIVGNPIRSEKMFYGREDDFRYVRTKLEGASQGVVIVFCGERRVGKSSILYQVMNGRLGDRFIPVFVDMQEMVIASDSEFFTRVSRLISEAVAGANSRELEAAANVETVRSGEEIEAYSDAAMVRGPRAAEAVPRPVTGASAAVIEPGFYGRNPYPVFIDFLEDVLRAIADRTLLILIDEYELMEPKVDEGKLSPELFTFLAGLMDNKERLALIFTGSRRLEERDRKYWRELLRRSLFRKVGFLSENDTRRLITEPVEGRVVYGRGVVDRIYRLTAGQPFYTQVICQNTVDHLNEHHQNWVTMADLTRVIGEIVDNPLPQMIYAWDGLSDDEKLVLSLMAETLPDGNTYATAAALRLSVKTNKYPVQLSENTIRVTLEEMFHREIVDKDSTGGFRFKMDLFRLWFHRAHSIWQVVNEVRTH